MLESLGRGGRTEEELEESRVAGAVIVRGININGIPVRRVVSIYGKDFTDILESMKLCDDHDRYPTTDMWMRAAFEKWVMLYKQGQDSRIESMSVINDSKVIIPGWSHEPIVDWN